MIFVRGILDGFDKLVAATTLSKVACPDQDNVQLLCRCTSVSGEAIFICRDGGTELALDSCAVLFVDFIRVKNMAVGR